MPAFVVLVADPGQSAIGVAPGRAHQRIAARNLRAVATNKLSETRNREQT